MSQDLVSPAGSAVANAPYELAPIEALFHEFVTRRIRMRSDKKWTDEFKPNLDKLSGFANDFTLNGVKVATMQLGQLNLSQLQKEQPEMVARYTRIVAEEKFDEAAFRQEQPDLWTAYRARKLMLVSGGLTKNQ